MLQDPGATNQIAAFQHYHSRAHAMLYYAKMCVRGGITHAILVNNFMLCSYDRS